MAASARASTASTCSVGAMDTSPMDSVTPCDKWPGRSATAARHRFMAFAAGLLVVDALEAVEVDQRDGEWLGGGVGGQLPQPFVQRAAVRQPGERVLQRLLGDGAVLGGKTFVLAPGLQRGRLRLAQRP